ncbi:MAG: 4-hydroxy-tetrahydrodipicolinate reductase [Parachlamydiales bacterium]|nr:4-hydroxy-tetrahydrodipicolinate reductase [Parachlamydiales bacterium]
MSIEKINDFRIGIIGYGKMGKMVQQIAFANEITVQSIIPSIEKLSHNLVENCDVLIDFSHASVAPRLIEQALSFQKPVVSGTTGWKPDVPLLTDLALKNKTAFLHATNFSLGFHIYNKLVAQSAEWLNKLGGYDVAGHEIHHNQKVDSPSGSAKTLAETLLKHFPQKKQTLYDTSYSQIDQNELHFSSTRIGSTVGTHTVMFDSFCDTIELTHRARTRDGFALGALKCAQWIKGKVGYFTIDDFIDSMKECCEVVS